MCSLHVYRSRPNFPAWITSSFMREPRRRPPAKKVHRALLPPLFNLVFNQISLLTALPSSSTQRECIPFCQNVTACPLSCLSSTQQKMLSIKVTRQSVHGESGDTQVVVPVCDAADDNTDRKRTCCWIPCLSRLHHLTRLPSFVVAYGCDL